MSKKKIEIREKDINEIMHLSEKWDVNGLKKLVSNLVNSKLSLKDEQKQPTKINPFEVYKDLFLWANVGIWFSDISSNCIEEVNKSFCELLEVSQENIVWRNISEFFTNMVADLDIYNKWKEIFKKQWELASFELKFRTANWWEKWLLVSSRWIEDLNKEFFTVQDITELKTLETARLEQIEALRCLDDERKQKIETLQLLDEQRKYMVNVMTHDMAWPIVSSLWLCNLISKKWKLDEYSKELMQRVISDLQKMERLVFNHLDIAKMERWEYVLRPQSISLVDMLEDKFKAFNLIYSEKGVSIRFWESFEKDITSLIWDKYWLEHLFDNVIKNAFEENIQHNSPFVEVVLLEEQNSVLICINNAWVIPENIKSGLFKERYIQSNKETWNWIWSYFSSLIAKIHKWEIFVWASCESCWTTICIRLAKNPL